MNIPFVDLKAQYAAIKDELNPVVLGVFESTQFIGGERLVAFENNFANYVGTKHGVGASSGTSAIHLALEALKIGRGDEVITACNTFIATTEAISQSGARPVLVDVDPATLNLDPKRVEAAITSKTKAIMPVHLYGQSADMDPLRGIAKRHNLVIVSDSAQAHGAEYKGRRDGIHGVLSTFSFYPGKNLGAYGDGGLVATDDAELAERMRMLLDHGRDGKYLHKEEGYNYRLDALQAAILDVKLRHLDSWTESRRRNAKRYDAAFAGTAIRPVGESPDAKHVYHLYIIRVANRDEVLAGLGKKGIAAGIHYPVPLHLQEAYRHLEHKAGDFPIAEAAAAEMLSLPMYPELTDEMVDHVVASVKELAR